MSFLEPILFPMDWEQELSPKISIKLLNSLKDLMLERFTSTVMTISKHALPLAESKTQESAKISAMKDCKATY